MEKLKTKLTVGTFQATQSMLPPIPAPKIVQIDEGSPSRKPDDLPKEPLIPPPSELFITESDQQIISSFYGMSKTPQDKGKKIPTDSDNSVKLVS
ncbi:unnamed protein product [Lactuca virosa]|uniref:Uncharacterized protein n=1 Tax=Lactuca virosa TaxID=75947 RepID=A0AAU9M919_9ASTR|nr:unnamed protein product [Lactuca virosa]